MSKLTRRHNNPLASVVSGNHIAADLSQLLAEQIRPSVDLAAQVSSSFSATAAMANVSALSQAWRNSLLPAQSSIADMIKRLTGTGSMPKLSDQLAAAMPSSIMPELYRGGFAARFAKAYDAGSTSKQAIKALTKIDMPPLAPTTTVPKFDRIYFTPAIDFANLFADTVPVADLFSELRSNNSDIFKETRQQLTDLFKRLNIDEYAASLPSNWIDAGLEDYDYGLLEQLILDEGLALAWVVKPDLLTQLLTAESESKRREMLAKHWEEITDHCCKLLDKVTSQELAEWRGFALKVAHALRHDNPEAAQALAASLIETMLVDNFTYDGKRERMKRENRPQISLGVISRGIVYGGLWGVFLQFRTDRDPIPSRFSRHASAHAVSTTQYTLTNSVIAFMHVVAYLYLWQEGDIEEKAV